jgi:murein DD-endopeptidase MepM/ murein hydrolase activator NlpD
MKRRSEQRGIVIPALVACFCTGMMVGWWLRSGAPQPSVPPAAPSGRVLVDPARREGPARESEVAATTGEPLVAPASPNSPKLPTLLPAAGTIGDVRGRGLRLPIDGMSVEAMKGGFAERRDAGGRPHEAVDILAPRNTPVYAVDDGTIAKLFESRAGGITVYQYDPSGRFCYYYAHLEHYASGLRENQRVSRGDVIGYVGTSGNAPPNTPHLHFAVFELDADRRWWKGRAIDPYLIFGP